MQGHICVRVCVKNEALFFMFYFRSSIFYIFLELHDLPDAYTLQAATTLNSSKRGMKMKNKKWTKIPQFSKWAKQNCIILKHGSS